MQRGIDFGEIAEGGPLPIGAAPVCLLQFANNTVSDIRCFDACTSRAGQLPPFPGGGVIEHDASPPMPATLHHKEVGCFTITPVTGLT
jgi:hypothetical protein